MLLAEENKRNYLPMKIITTHSHGWLDYITGLLLITGPWLLQFDPAGPQTWVPAVVGSVTILYSLFTNYESGIVKLIPVRTHLNLDTLNAVIQIVSPWSFGFADLVWIPHFFAGLFQMAVALLINPHPAAESATRRQQRLHKQLRVNNN